MIDCLVHLHNFRFNNLYPIKRDEPFPSIFALLAPARVEPARRARQGAIFDGIRRQFVKRQGEGGQQLRGRAGLAARPCGCAPGGRSANPSRKAPESPRSGVPVRRCPASTGRCRWHAHRRARYFIRHGHRTVSGGPCSRPFAHRSVNFPAPSAKTILETRSSAISRVGRG